MGVLRRWIRKLDGWTAWGDAGLADEATAYLQGRLLEQRRATGAGGQVPPWLWLNAVAHGDPVRLRELADVARPGTVVTGWRATRAALAREVMDRTGGNPDEVAALQREVLVPLENRLEGVPELTPARLHEIAIQEMWLIGS